MIPLLHEFTGERVLVVGGGRVGARKARRFAREATVIVLSPAFADAAFGGAALVRAAPGPDDVAVWIDRADPVLVVAATDDGALNAAVERAGRERGILVNRADRGGDREPGDVVVPATVRDDPVVVAVATGATSPGVSRSLREAIEPQIEGAGAVATATAAVRDDLRERGVDPGTRRQVLRRVVASDRVWDAARSPDGDAEAVAADVAAEALADGDEL